MKMNKSAAKPALKTTGKVTNPPPANTNGQRPAIASAAASTPVAQKATSSPTGATGSASGAVTTIDVKIDVGFGNSLFLRGQGSGLTWDHGVPLICVDGKTWRWSQKATDPIKFKLLLNDQVWSAGNDLTITPGERLEIAPQFA